MMRQSIIQAALVLLLTVFMSHITEGGETNDAKQIDLTKQLDEIQPSLIENSEFRVARDARRKLRTRRKGNNQNQKQIVEGERKRGKVNKNKEKIKKKTRQNKMNRRKFKKKEKKNKEKNTKYKKKSTKTEKKSKPNKSKHNSEHSKKKKKSEQKKKSRKNKNKLRKKSKNSIQQKSKKDKLSKLKSKQGCDEKVLCQKIKDFIKYGNLLRQFRRMNRSCVTMEKKATKSAYVFEETVTSLEDAILSSSVRLMNRFRWKRDRVSINELTSIKERLQRERSSISSNDVTSIKNRLQWGRASISINEVKSIIDDLKNCSVSAKEKCSFAPCQEEKEKTLFLDCEKALNDWTTKFGPSNGSCLKNSTDCCACITALTHVESKCLIDPKVMKAKLDQVLDRKNKCTGGTEHGSFGFCKKRQIEAAEKGSKYVQDSCKKMGGLATKGPGGGTSAMTSATTAEDVVPPIIGGVVPPAEVTASDKPTTTMRSTTKCTPPVCGVKKQGTKITGGTDAMVNESPWMAYVSLGCGASIVADKWLVTAANCFYNDDDPLNPFITTETIGSLKVQVGDFQTSLLKDLTPDQILIHENYNHKKHLNDIALVRVPDLTGYTSVCLPTPNKYDGRRASVYGWGDRTDGNIPTFTNLKKLEVTINSDDEARRAYQNTISPLTNSQLDVMVFAGGERDKDACKGDNGGPLTYNNNNKHELVGIVSWGLGCGVQGLPRAYTEVASFKDWIIRKTNICQN